MLISTSVHLDNEPVEMTVGGSGWLSIKQGGYTDITIHVHWLTGDNRKNFCAMLRDAADELEKM